MEPVSVDDIIAHAVYDPVARRERYLKARQLKGRTPGRPPPVKVGLGSRIVDANTPIGSARHYAPTAVSIAQQRAAASSARQIADIKAKLNTLRAHLKELLAKQKAESASRSKSSTTSTKKTTSSTQTAKPKTAKQKQAAKESLKKAQATRAQQQKQTPNAQPLSLDEQITRTRAVITDVEAKLRAAIERARTQTASNGRG